MLAAKVGAHLGYARGCRRIVDHALRSAFEPEARTMLPEPKRRTAWESGDVLKRSVALWVKDAMGR